MKRILCLIIAILIIGSNCTLAFAALIYNSSKDRIYDFTDKDGQFHNSNFITRAQISSENFIYDEVMGYIIGDTYKLVGSDVEEDSTVTLDRASKKSFSLVNYKYNIYKGNIFKSVADDLWDNWKSYGLHDAITLDDGIQYYIEVIKEEILFEDLIFKHENSMDGKFTLTGEYSLIPPNGPSKNMKVNISGIIEEYDFVLIQPNNDLQGLGLVNLNYYLKPYDNIVTIDIDGQSIERKFLKYRHNGYLAEDVGKIGLEVHMRILKAEFEKEVMTAGQITVASALSIAMATTGSVALSTISASSSEIFGNSDDENLNNTIEKDDNDAIWHSIIINNNEALPLLANTKGAVVDIPLYIEDGEDLIWEYIVVPFIPKGLGSIVPAIINPTGSNSTSISLSISGKKFEDNSVQAFINVFASAYSGDEKHKANTTLELALYNLGLHAAVKDKNKDITKENLNVTYIFNSKLKGIAEIIKLNNNDYEIMIIEETETAIKVNIAANNKEYGNYVLSIEK